MSLLKAIEWVRRECGAQQAAAAAPQHHITVDGVRIELACLRFEIAETQIQALYAPVDASAIDLSSRLRMGARVSASLDGRSFADADACLSRGGDELRIPSALPWWKKTNRATMTASFDPRTGTLTHVSLHCRCTA